MRLLKPLARSSLLKIKRPDWKLRAPLTAGQRQKEGWKFLLSEKKYMFFFSFTLNELIISLIFPIFCQDDFQLFFSSSSYVLGIMMHYRLLWQK